MMVSPLKHNVYWHVEYGEERIDKDRVFRNSGNSDNR